MILFYTLLCKIIIRCSPGLKGYVFLCWPANRPDWVPVFLEMPYCLAVGSFCLKQNKLLGQHLIHNLISWQLGRLSHTFLLQGLVVAARRACYLFSGWRRFITFYLEKSLKLAELTHGICAWEATWVTLHPSLIVVSSSFDWGFCAC